MATLSTTIKYAADVSEMKRSILDGTGSIVAMKEAVDRTVQSLGGGGLLAAANKMTAAIIEMGGANKLTASEQDRVNTLLEKALDKYQALGVAAPPAMREIADATKKTDENSQSLLARLDGGTGIIAGFVAAFSVERILEFGKALLESLSRIEDLSRATGISTAGIQRMAYAGAEFGVDVEMMARGVEQFSAKLANGDKNATMAVNSLGLSVKSLIASGPEEAFLTFADAAGRLADPMDKAGVMAEALGGRLAKTLIPAIGELRQKIQEVPKDAIISDENVKAAHAFDVELQHIETRLKAKVVSAAGTLGGWFDKMFGTAEDERRRVAATFGGSFAPDNAHDIPLSAGPTAETISHADKIKNAIKGLIDDATMPLSASMKSNIALMHEYGIGAAEIAKAIDVPEAAVGKFIKALTEAETYTKQWQKAFDNLQPYLNNANWDGSVKGLLAIGAAVNDVAVYMGESEGAVRNVDQALKDEIATARIMQEVHKKAFEAFLSQQKQFSAMIAAMAKQEADAVVAGFYQIQAARKQYDDVIGAQTLTSTQFQIQKIDEWADAQKRAFKGTADQRIVFDGLIDQSAAAQVDALYIDDKAMRDHSIESLQEVANRAQTTYEAMAADPENYSARTIAYFKRIAQEAQASANGTKTAWQQAYEVIGGIGTILSELPGKFAQVGAIAAQTVDAVMNRLAQGDVFGAVVAGVSGAIRAIKQLLGGPSQEELQGRQADTSFEQQIQSTLTAQQKLEANGVSWKETVIGVRDAYVKAGLSAKQAEADVAMLWAAEKQGAEATKAAIAQINHNIGLAKAGQDALNGALSRYKFTTEELGPALRRQNLDKQSQQLYQDWIALTAAGISVSTVTQKMSKDIQSYVTEALKTGTEIPSAMRPMLQSMVDSGTLLDQNGKKITDLNSSGITFSETMTEGFQSIVGAVHELANAIRASLGLALDDTASKASNLANQFANMQPPSFSVNPYDPSMTSGSFPGMPGYASGTPGFVDFGAGTPVVLHGWEAVIPKDSAPESFSAGRLIPFPAAPIISSTASPSSSSSQAATGTVVHIGGITVHATDAKSVQRAIPELARQLREHIASGGREQTAWKKAVA